MNHSQIEEMRKLGWLESPPNLTLAPLQENKPVERISPFSLLFRKRKETPKIDPVVIQEAVKGLECIEETTIPDEELSKKPKTALMFYQKISHLTDRIDVLEEMFNEIIEKVDSLENSAQKNDNANILSKIDELKGLFQTK